MRKLLFLALFALSITPVHAQKVREELKNDLFKAGSNYYAYPEPEGKPSPAPKGKKPFYISTYARHGSRFLIKGREYEAPFQVLKQAHDLGKLSDTGQKTYEWLDWLRQEAKDRYGDLTPLGASQHRKIAQRMYDNYPEIFKGKTIVDARSTIVIRCILSMQNEVTQLVRNNPQLIIRTDASEHDMYYMNLQDSALYKKRLNAETRQVYADFCKRHEVYQQAMAKLFCDSVYYRDNVDAFELNRSLFKIASSVQGTEMRYHFNLFDIYTIDELYDNWLQANAYWYLCFGNNPYNGGTQPFTQRKLLRKIIEEADSCIAVPRNSASLRFGHETIVLPLTCLLNLNGFGRQIDDLEQLDLQGWINFEVFPMAANIQFVFYRKDPKDKDVLLKVLLNENEATLPIESDCPPYYHWSDFRDYYLRKLDSYQEE